jgi:hypothetical protein
MTKHARNSKHLQAVDLPKTMAVEIPLPLLGAFANIEKSFFELCIDSGQQVLTAMMEQGPQRSLRSSLEARSKSICWTRRNHAE